jgi:hypothetical protein
VLFGLIDLWGARVRTEILAIAAVMACVPACAQADLLVVRSAGVLASRIRAGTNLPDNAVVKLQQGDFLALLDNRGIRELRGPAIVNLAEASAPSKPISLFDFEGGQRAVIAGSRAPKAPVNTITPTASFVQCVIDGWQTYLVRADSLVAYQVKSASGGPDAMVQFDEYDRRVKWPSGLALRNGLNSFRIRDAKSGAESSIGLRVVPSVPVSNMAYAATLIANGCDEQLLESMEKHAD